MDFPWLHSMVPQRVYDSEHRTVYFVRLAVHSAGTIMIFTGSAGHPFLQANRKLMAASLVLVFLCMGMEEVYLNFPDPNLRVIKLFCFKVAESCLAALVLLGCFLLRSITLKETYRLNNIFFIALGLHFAVLALDNVVKLGYLGNTIIALVALVTLRDFLSAFQEGSGGSQAANVRALMRLQAMLTVLNIVTFVSSIYYRVFALKLAQYVLQIFAITLFYLFVRPFIETEPVPSNSDVDKLLGHSV